MEKTARQPNVWWGEFSLDVDSARLWQIGPLRLRITRSQKEWRIGLSRSDELLDSSLRICEPVDNETSEDGQIVQRYGFRKTESVLRIRPVLADRAIVVKPETTFYLPPHEEASLFVSSPLWVQVWTEDPPALLIDEPVFRPSDTWFGPSTLEGELCYASRTSARIRLENIPIHSHRAVTLLRIRNRAETRLLLDRLKLPIENLTLFASTSGQLWMETVTLEREGDLDFARVRVGKGAPPVAGETVLVAKPRRMPEKGFLTRAFSGVFASEGT